MTNKERYRQLCETEGSLIPLFQQYWWMDTVCEGKQWDVLLCEDNCHICGAMPFLYGKRFGIKYILQPQLTPWNGPWLRQGMSDHCRKTTLNTLAQAFHGQHAKLCMQRFAPGMNEWQPFLQYRFNHTTRYTYRFDPLPKPSALKGLAAKERRKGIEAVENTYTVDRFVDADEFANFHIAYWERRSGKDLLSRDFIQRVCSTSLNRGQGLLYGLRNKYGTLMAARFVVLDSECAYSLLSALHADSLRNSMTMLVWAMLTDLYGHTKAFDFEGGMESGIGHFYHSFGTTRTEIHCIYRSRIPFGEKLLHL